MLIELRLWSILEKAGGERVDGFRVSTDAGDPPVTLPYRDVPAQRAGSSA